jgi:hypothetical protein
MPPQLTTFGGAEVHDRLMVAFAPADTPPFDYWNVNPTFSNKPHPRPQGGAYAVLLPRASEAFASTSAYETSSRRRSALKRW